MMEMNMMVTLGRWLCIGDQQTHHSSTSLLEGLTFGLIAGCESSHACAPPYLSSLLPSAASVSGMDLGVTRVGDGWMKCVTIIVATRLRKDDTAKSCRAGAASCYGHALHSELRSRSVP